MDLRLLPLELLEHIFIHLDTQALAACALADPELSDIVYSSHFLDVYCRKSLCCSWVTAADVCNACISIPYEFWFWVHTTFKVEELGQSSVYVHNKNLTKIGCLQHMYIMWLTCGLRPSLVYSHTIMHELYTLPKTVDHVFKGPGMGGSNPGTFIKNILVKIFLALPEIMELTCANLTLFRMQQGGSKSIHMDLVCNDGIKPRLPYDFIPLFSVELILSALFGKNPSLLILISKDMWVLWLGYLSITFDTNETTILDNSFCKYFKTESISDIRYYAHHALSDMNGFVNSTRHGTACSIISGTRPEMAVRTLEIAQDHHRCLQHKFSILLNEGCGKLVRDLIQRENKGIARKDNVVDFLKRRVCTGSLVNDFVIGFLDTNMGKIKCNPSEQLNYLVYKCILERLACLFRNEIQLCAENRFCHSFLCGCISLPMERKSSRNLEHRLQQCLAQKTKDGINSPRLWPPHVLSAACHAIPLLLEVLEKDITFIMTRNAKYVVPKSVQNQINNRLQDAGMCLTNRPPSKPRCPPLLTQIRLWSIESSM